MSHSLPPNIVITAAQPSDIPALLEMSRLCFLSDSHTQMKDAIKGTTWGAPDDEGSRAHLKSLLDSSRVDVLVARDTSAAGAVVGSVSWVRSGSYGDTTNSSNGTAAAAGVGDGGASAGVGGRMQDPTPRVWGPTPRQPAVPTGRALTVSDLQAITSQSMSAWQEYLCPPSARCRFIAGLTVHPDYQRRGIATALMRWGTAKADEEGVYCWVQSSMGAEGAYEAAGFVRVGQLELDLDLFAEGTTSPDRGGDGRWGVYVWPYMRRDARPTKPQATSTAAE